MASWEDNLSALGYWRGQSFYYGKVDGEIGRRTVLKEYPSDPSGTQKKPFVEDIGPATQKFSIDMFVIGDNYDFQRDALRAAFLKPGPGELLHPYWGKMQVTVVGTVRVTESTTERRMARFTATFALTGKQQRELLTVNTVDNVLTEADNLAAAISAAFQAAYSTVKAIESTVQTAIDAVNDVALAADVIRGRIASALLLIDSAEQAVSGAVKAVTGAINTLISLPQQLVAGVQGMVSSIAGSIASVSSAFDAAATFFGGEDAVPAEGNVIAVKTRADVFNKAIADFRAIPDTLPSVGPATGASATAQQEALKIANNAAIIQLVRAASISAVATTAVSISYDNYQQAQTIRQALTDFIDDLMLDPTLDDSVYQPLVNLRTALVQHFAQAASTLPELVDYTPKVTLPALVLAYQLYGDATRDAEILARNQQIRDPSAVTGGQPIQVPSMPDASLTVNGKEHSGWTDISVTRSLEQFAHTFEIGFTEQWTDFQDPVPIREGDECTLRLDGNTATSGFVVDASVDYDATEHSMKVSGSSYVADLVDCSALQKGGHWKNQTLESIARDLCSPFNISVRVDEVLGDMGGPFPSFGLQDAETVYEALDRASRMRGVLMTATPDGELLFTGIGSLVTKTTIERGVNVLKGGRAGSWKDRFGTYILKSQQPSTDNDTGIPITRQKAVATDDVVTRYRPLIVVAEQHMGSASKLQTRANWERSVRGGRAIRLTYTVDSWSNAEGLWAPNTLVRVKDPALQVDTTLLVISVRQTKSNTDGSNTELVLGDLRSLTPEPLTKQPNGNNKWLTYLNGSSQ